MTARARFAWIVLFLLVLVSLASNVYLITVALKLQAQITSASNTAGVALDNAAHQLKTIETQEFSMLVPINEEIPVEATIDFDEEFIVPVNVDIPIKTSVTVPLEMGVFGTYHLNIPIDTTVPVDVDVPVQIRKKVPIDTVVPVELDVPVSISLEGTPMAKHLSQWRGMLVDLRDQLP